MKFRGFENPHSSRQTNTRLGLAFVVLTAAILVAITIGSTVTAQKKGGGLTGAVYTTDINCGGVDINTFYPDKQAVYLNGGPQNQNSGSGLPDGSYYVRVTTPSDATVLGSSIGGPVGDQPVHVTNGHFDTCYQLWAIVSPAAGGGPGYYDTSNPGGEYKVWVCNNANFDESGCKTDNFKVNRASPSPTPPQDGALQILKFYDANQNGNKDPGEVYLSGWKVDVSPVIGSNPVLTPFNATITPGTYTATERDTIETNWFASTSKTLTAVVALNNTTTIEFGNWCELTPGGHTVGYWSNPNGQKEENDQDFVDLTNLHLVNADGTPRDFTAALNVNKKNLNTWILGAKAVNMSYMLSAQLAATKLSVNHGYTTTYVIVDTTNGPMDVLQFIAYADSLLATDGYAVAGDPNRAEQERVKNILDKINNGGSFVQPSAAHCPYTFLP